MFAPNNRNHRKTIVVDGSQAFFGGMNVGNEYFGLGLRSRYWADSHSRIQGPAVADLQQVFAEDWSFATDEILDDVLYFPETPTFGTTRAQIVVDKWATIGSANLDNRSLQLNFEVQCLLDDTASAAAIRAHFDAEFAHEREIAREEFATRSIWSRAAEALAHAWSPLL